MIDQLDIQTLDNLGTMVPKPKTEGQFIAASEVLDNLSPMGDMPKEVD